MQITTTSIRHKRYSTYGWNLKENNEYVNTLSQGEMGILLGHEYIENDQVKVEPIELAGTGKELNCVLEVRIGTKDNQHYFDAMIINTRDNVDYSIREYDTPAKLPSFGKSGILYVVKSNNTIYRWDDFTTSWIPLISGSSGEGACKCDLTNYYTKDEIDSILNSWVDEILNIEMIDGGDCRGQSSVTI